MYFILLTLLLGLCGIFMPRTYRILEVLVLAPIVGCAAGGFTWAISAMFCNALITWAAFGSFLLGGTVLTEVAFAKSH